MNCKACGLPEHPLIPCGRARRLAGIVNTTVNTTEQPVNTKPTKPRNADRHKPGYMAEYMRRDRAKKRAAKQP